jgi:hypothetical protein
MLEEGAGASPCIRYAICQAIRRTGGEGSSKLFISTNLPSTAQSKSPGKF